MKTVKYSKSELVDIITWDIYNWSECLNYWPKYINGKSLQCLELGAKSGGLSLWLSMNGQGQAFIRSLRSQKEVSIVAGVGFRW